MVLPEDVDSGVSMYYAFSDVDTVVVPAGNTQTQIVLAYGMADQAIKARFGAVYRIPFLLSDTERRRTR